MNKIIIGIIIIILLIIGIVVFTGGEREPAVDSSDEAREVAENWIVSNAPTYVFDGFDLSFVEVEEFEEGTYLVTYSFDSRAAGYGDRTDEVSAQVITSHLIEVTVVNGQVVSAITDGVYNEMAGEMLEEDVVTPETTTISLYFVRVVDGQEEVVEVVREIPYTLAVGRAAVEELLRGPSAQEEAEGLSTAIPEGTELISIEVEEGVARVDFNESLQEGVAGSAWVLTVRGQIESTLLQFDTVQEVVISIEGEIEDILQP